MPDPFLPKNDRLAAGVIFTVSAVVFIAVVILGRVELDYDPGFDIHHFARLNAVINSLVSVLLVAGLLTARRRRFVAHQRVMLTAVALSTLFLISYIAHHLLAGSTSFGGEGLIRLVYYLILVAHIILAAVILPFILFTVYRAGTGEYRLHRRLASVTWPIWFFVSVSGVVVYLMISPYYP